VNSRQRKCPPRLSGTRRGPRRGAASIRVTFPQTRSRSCRDRRCGRPLGAARRRRTTTRYRRVSLGREREPRPIASIALADIADDDASGSAGEPLAELGRGQRRAQCDIAGCRLRRREDAGPDAASATPSSRSSTSGGCPRLIRIVHQVRSAAQRWSNTARTSGAFLSPSGTFGGNRNLPRGRLCLLSLIGPGKITVSVRARPTARQTPQAMMLPLQCPELPEVRDDSARPRR